MIGLLRPAGCWVSVRMIKAGLSIQAGFKANYSALLLCFFKSSQSKKKKKFKYHFKLQITDSIKKNCNTSQAAKRAFEMAWNRAEMKSSLSVPFPSICFICTWLICMAETWAEHTEEWLGELGRDLQGPMESCCFFLVETIFWATEGKENTQAGQAEHPWEAGHSRRAHGEQHTDSGASATKACSKHGGKGPWARTRGLVFQEAPWRLQLGSPQGGCDSRSLIPPGEHQRTRGKKLQKAIPGILYQASSVFLTPH